MSGKNNIPGILLAIVLAVADCGQKQDQNKPASVAPLVAFGPSLGSDAVLINGTGINRPVASTPPRGCLSRVTGITGNDVNCDESFAYLGELSCQLNYYPGYQNFLVEKCPSTNHLGGCLKFSGATANTLHYYAGYQIVSPSTQISVIQADCTLFGGVWVTTTP